MAGHRTGGAMEYLILTGVLLFLLFLIYGYVLNFALKTEYYTVSSASIRQDIRLVLLTDLHACEHGPGNSRLLNKIQQLSPDFICIAGDMTVKGGKNTESVLVFLHRLSQRYPIYYAPGNHEIRMTEHHEYRRRLQEMGIQYLENQTISLKENICIAGLDMPEYWYHKFWQKRVCSPEYIEELLGSRKKGAFTILLAHNPEYFPCYAEWGADLTLSGHIHGGMARLPLLGGVISPSLRLFPKYDAGQYESRGRFMILSRGLGLHDIKFRFFNVPEISCIKLQKMAR